MKLLIFFLFNLFLFADQNIFLKIKNESLSGSVIKVEIDKTNNSLYVAGDKHISLYSLDKLKLKTQFFGEIGTGLNGKINSIAINKNDLAVSGAFAKSSIDKKMLHVRIYDKETSKIKKTVKLNTIGMILDLTYSLDGKYLICLAPDKVFILSTDRYEVIKEFIFAYKDYKVKSDRNYFIIATYDGEILLLDNKNFELIKKVKFDSLISDYDFDEKNIYVGSGQKLYKIDKKSFFVKEIFKANKVISSISLDENNILVAEGTSIIKSQQNMLESGEYKLYSIDLISHRVTEKEKTKGKPTYFVRSIGNGDYLICADGFIKNKKFKLTSGYQQLTSVGMKDNIYFSNTYDTLKLVKQQQVLNEITDRYEKNNKFTVMFQSKLYELNHTLNLHKFGIKELDIAPSIQNYITNIYEDYMFVLTPNHLNTLNAVVHIAKNRKEIGSTSSIQATEPITTAGFYKSDFFLFGSIGSVLYAINLDGSHKAYLNGNGINAKSLFANDKFLFTSYNNGIIDIWDINQIKIAKPKKIINKNNLEKLALKMGMSVEKIIKLAELNYINKANIYSEKVEKVYPQLTIFVDKNNEFIIWTEEGYFTVSSQEALKYIAWHMNQGHDKEAIRYDMGKFYDVFFRPDLVKLKLQGKDITAYTNGLTAKEALKNPPPEIKISMINNRIIQHKNDLTEIVKINTTKKTAKVRFDISDFGGGIGSIRLYQEGKLIKTIGTNSIQKTIANVDKKYIEEEAENYLKEHQLLALSKAMNGKSLEIDEQILKVKRTKIVKNKEGSYEIEVPLKAGDNYLSVEAFNKTNTISSFRSTVNINANIPKRKPKLYAIVAGVNKFDFNWVQDLKYALNDAKAIEQLVNSSKGEIFTDVETIYLKNDLVTKENIMNAFDEVKAKAFLEDTIIFYISTHGKSVNGKFYLVPSNNKRTDNLIEFGDIFKESSNVKALNQIFIIDACQSGSANDIASAVYDSRASVLARSSGIHLLSASTSGTNAFENDKYKHSNFTYQIIQAVNNAESDNNKDGFISIIEVSDILKQQDLNNTKQFPVIQNIGNDIYLNRF